MKHKQLVVRLLICIVLLEPAARLFLTLTAFHPPEAFSASYRLDWMDGYWQPENYASPTLNIIDGERRTVGQPEHYEHTIYLYGNSLVFGFNVSDDATIASQLQRLTTYRVVNRGAIGQAARGVYAWLRATPLRPGDVVIFGGAGDGAAIERRARPVAQWIWQECDLPAERRSIVTVFAVVCQVAGGLPPDPAVVRAGMADYEQTLVEMKAYTEQRSATFMMMPGARLSADDYVDGYGHYNAHGAALVAHAIYDRLAIY